MRMYETRVPFDIRERMPCRFITAFEILETSVGDERRLPYFTDVMSWCYEQFGEGQSIINYKAYPKTDTVWLYHAVSCIVVSRPDDAFEFKMRWC